MATVLRQVSPPECQGPIPAPARARLRVPEQKLVPRPRLLSRLHVSSNARLIILQAPAGYGKTSLMQQWADERSAQGDEVVWLGLDARDRDPMYLAKHLDKALEESKAPAGDANPSQETAYYGWQALLESIGDRFVERGRPCWIFFDDAHELAGSAAVAGLKVLVETAPRDLRFVVGTRGDSGLPLGALRAHHDVVELGMGELRFNDDETLAYLRSREELDLEQPHVSLLQQRAEGWIVGIKLFSLALSLEPENRYILESLTGERRQIADFFLEDVLSRQPQELQEFLLRISLLDEFCPALCDAVLEADDSRSHVDRCEASGLFLQERDQTRTWYRFHHLFAQFLRRQLQDRMPSEASAIYRRAADWLAANGHHTAAFDCAIRAQDHMHAARILDGQCEQMFAMGLQPTLQEMASRLPQQIIALYPRLMLSLAWRLVAQWRLAEARTLVSVARQRVQEASISPDTSQEIDGLKLRIEHREMMIAYAAYQLEELEERSLKAIQRNNRFEVEPYLMGSFHNSLQFAQREQFKLGKIERLDQAARELVARTGARHGEIFISGITGQSLILMGQTQRAGEMLSSSLELAQRIGGRDDPLGAIVAPALAMLHYEVNELDEAQALLTKYLPVMTSAGFVEQLATGWITQARLHMARQEAESCLTTLDEAIEFGSRFELDSLRIAANAEKLRVLLKLGRPDDAARFARRRGFVAPEPGGQGRVPLKDRYTVLDSAVAMANCRLLAADDRFGDALALARRWRSFVGASQAVLAAVEWDVLVAELLFLSGERLAAQRAIIQALRKASPGRLIRRFLDKGEPVGGMLQQLAQSGGGLAEPEEAFLQEIVTCLGPAIDAEPSDEDDLDEERGIILGRITSRELEILAMAGHGVLNRDIGEQLGLTEGTVKWYLQQVYDKIGIRNRKQALQRARKLGLIT